MASHAPPVARQSRSQERPAPANHVAPVEPLAEPSSALDQTQMMLNQSEPVGQLAAMSENLQSNWRMGTAASSNVTQLGKKKKNKNKKKRKKEKEKQHDVHVAREKQYDEEIDELESSEDDSLLEDVQVYPPWASRMSRETGLDIVQIMDIANVFEDVYAYFQNEVNLDEEDWGEWARQVEGHEWELATITTPGSGGNKSDWATSAVRGLARRMADEGDKALFLNGTYTVHHKVARSKLGLALEQLKTAGQEGNTLRVFLDELGAQRLSGAGHRKSLLSLPANLELGPQETLNDPGSNFDGNYLPDGQMTPRSKLLDQVDGLLDATPIDLTEVALRLRQVQNYHDEHYDNALISRPMTDQWEKGAGKKGAGKFARRGRPEK